MSPDDDAAFGLACQILDSAARWRPMPDLTVVLTDEVDAAIHRAETRDGEPFTSEQRHLLHRTAAMFERLATLDPEHVRTLDRREHDTDTLVDIITAWIADAPARPFHGLVPAATLP
jgi:dTMP kinase